MEGAEEGKGQKKEGSKNTESNQMIRTGAGALTSSAAGRTGWGAGQANEWEPLIIIGSHLYPLHNPTPLLALT